VFKSKEIGFSQKGALIKKMALWKQIGILQPAIT
jgi:hypothetical protein